MEKQAITNLAEKIVREEIRKGELGKNRDVLSLLPDVLNTVHLDHDAMRASIEACLSTKNPINTILKLFDVQIIKKQKTISSLVDSSSEQVSASVEHDALNDKRWLSLDSEKLKSTVEEMAQKLVEQDNQSNKAREDEKSHYNDLFRKNAALEKEFAEFRYTAETTERMIAKRVQNMLFLNGKVTDSENEQLIELLKDMSIDVYWNSENAPLPDAAMFEEYLVEEESMTGIQPCLMQEGLIYVKGIRFIKK